MPPQQVKSQLQAKYGNRTAKLLQEAKSAPVEYGRQDLPPGIKNGIARLEKAYFGTFKTGDNQGEMFLYLEGTVIEPYSVIVDGREVTVEGQATKQILPYCATKGTKPKTQAENIKIITNEIRKLGGEDFLDGVKDEAGLETRVNQLQEAHPHFKFETRQGKPTPEYPNPRTFESWFGSKGLENYVPGEAGGVDDETGGTTASSNGVATAETDTTPAFDEFGDIDSLVETASSDEESQERTEAQQRLEAMAKEAGISDEDIAAAVSWQALSELIGGGPSTEPGDDGAAVTPKAGEVWKFFPVDPKTKKPGKKAVQVKIVKVDEKGRTVSAKNLDNPKLTYASIGFDDLVEDN